MVRFLVALTDLNIYRFAGQETLSSTLTWIFGLLIGYPECQAKLHEELDRVIGEKRMIRLADKPNLPYLNAVIAVSRGWPLR